MATRRNESSIREKAEQAALTFLLGVITGTDKPGDRPRTTRDRIMAARTLAMFKQSELKRAALELRRERQEGQTTENSLAVLVAEAETRAEERKNERDEAACCKPRARRRPS
jgi:hypothetical protein